MIPLDRAQKLFLTFITILLVVTGLYLKLGAIVGRMYIKIVDQQYVIGCSSTYIPEIPNDVPFYSESPTSEECADLVQELCAYRSLCGGIFLSISTLLLGGPLSLFLLRRFKDKHRLFWGTCLILYLTSIALVMLNYPMIIYLALRTLYINC